MYVYIISVKQKTFVQLKYQLFNFQRKSMEKYFISMFILSHFYWSIYHSIKKKNFFALYHGYTYIFILHINN